MRDKSALGQVCIANDMPHLRARLLVNKSFVNLVNFNRFVKELSLLGYWQSCFLNVNNNATFK